MTMHGHFVGLQALMKTIPRKRIVMLAHLMRSTILILLVFPCPLKGSLPLQQDVQGLPPIRNYPLEEIGNISAGVILQTDPIGRLLVIQEGSYIVFDGENWTNILDETDPNRNFSFVNSTEKGTTYYGGSGNWGTIEYQPNGLIKTHSLRPDDAPAWATNGALNSILFEGNKTLFAGDTGVILLDQDSEQQTFFEIPEVETIFKIRNYFYAPSFVKGLVRIDPNTGDSTVISTNADFRAHLFTPWDEDHVLFINQAMDCNIFDGNSLQSWKTQIDSLLKNGVACVERIDSDSIAIAIKNTGLFILNKNGELKAHYQSEAFFGNL